MKHLTILALILALFSAPVARATPTNLRVTITAGTPVQLSTQRIRVHSILIQMRTGGTGRGYILRVAQGVTPSAANGAHLSAELSPATTTAPGGAYADSDVAPFQARKEIWLNEIWVDGTVSTDTVTCTWDPYQ